MNVKSQCHTSTRRSRSQKSTTIGGSSYVIFCPRRLINKKSFQNREPQRIFRCKRSFRTPLLLFGKLAIKSFAWNSRAYIFVTYFLLRSRLKIESDQSKVVCEIGSSRNLIRAIAISSFVHTRSSQKNFLLASKMKQNWQREG